MLISAYWVRSLRRGDTGVNISAYDGVEVPASVDDTFSLNDGVEPMDIKYKEIEDPFTGLLARLDIALGEPTDVGARLMDALMILEEYLKREEHDLSIVPSNPVVLSREGDLWIHFFINSPSAGSDSKKVIFQKLRFHLQQWKEEHAAKLGAPVKRAANG